MFQVSRPFVSSTVEGAGYAETKSITLVGKVSVSGAGSRVVEGELGHGWLVVTRKAAASRFNVSPNSYDFGAPVVSTPAVNDRADQLSEQSLPVVA